MLRRFLLVLTAGGVAWGHDVITTKVTFDREIIRLFNSHCISCHREGGAAFSLATYKDARPWAKAIGEEVLQRRMPGLQDHLVPAGCEDRGDRRLADVAAPAPADRHSEAARNDDGGSRLA